MRTFDAQQAVFHQPVEVGPSVDRGIVVNRTFEELSERQARLVEHAAAQRVELAEIHTGLEKPLTWLLGGLVVIRSVRTHPQVALLSVLAAFLTFGRHISKARSWAARGLAIYQLYKILVWRFLKR